MAKTFGIMSPFMLKRIVDSLTVGASIGVGGTATAALAGAAGGSITLTKTIRNIGLWGITCVLSRILLCFQMNSLTKGIQSGLTTISKISYAHQLDLDPYYHKNRANNTVYEIN